MLQARIKGSNDPFYAPHRDIAYLFPHICVQAMKGLDAGNWEPWYKEWLDHNKLKEEDLGNGAVLLAQFVNQATAVVNDTLPQHTLERIGWFKLPNAVQFVILAKLGQMAMAGYFVGIREVTHLDEPPPLDVARVVRIAGETAHYMSMPRWYRMLVRRWHGFKNWLGRKLLKHKEDTPELPNGPMPFAGQDKMAAAYQTTITVNPQAELPAKLPKPGIDPSTVAQHKE